MFGGSASVRTIQTVFTAQDRASAKMQAVEGAGDDAADSIGRAEQRLDGVTQMMAVTGTAAVGLAGTIGFLTSRYSRLGRELQTIQTTTGASTEQMDELRDAIKGVSTAFPTTLQQSTRAAQALSFAGLSAEESMSALTETTQLAVATQLQAGQSAEIVAQSLNAFGLEAQQAEAVVGSLGATFSTSSTRVRGLSQALTEVQSTASAAGLSVAGTVGALGVLADNGLQASKAGTSLNAVLSRLTGNSSETQEAMQQLGVSTSDFTDSSGNLRNVTSIMATLSQSMEGVESQAERVRLAQQLVGREGARALLPLLNSTDQLASKYRDNLRAQIQGAVGDLAEMEEAELGNAGTALGMEVSGETSTTALISNLQRLNEQGESTADITSRLQVGLGLTEDAASHLATQVTETDQSATQLAEGITGVTTAADLAEDRAATLSGQIQQLRSSLAVLGYEVFQGTKPAVTGLVGTLNSAVTPVSENEQAAKALGVGLVGLTGAAGIATAGLAAHAAQLRLTTLAQQTQASSTVAGTAALKGHAVATAAASKAQFLMTASSGQLLAATTAKTGALVASTTAMYGSVTAALSGATAMGVFTGATSLASGALAGFLGLLGPAGWAVIALAAAGGALAAIWSGDLFGAGKAAGSVIGWFGDQAATAWAITEQGLGILWQLARIGGTIAGLSLVAPFAALLKLPGFIEQAGPKAKQAAAQLPGQVISGLNSMGRWKYLVPFIGPLWGLHDAITQFGPEAKQAAAQLPGQVIAGLDSMGRWKYLVPILGPVLAARDMLTNPKKWKQAGRQIPHTIAAGIGDAADAPVDAVAGMVGDAREFLPFSPAARGPLQSLPESGEALVTTLAEGVENEQGQLASSVSAALGATPLGMATTAAIDVATDSGTGSRGSQRTNSRARRGDPQPSMSVTIEEINIGDSDASSDDVERAARRGTSDAFEEFLRRISREVTSTPTGGRR